ncbi:MAG TPA: hypothetical protein PKA00_12695 [Saprospiraceae bacterium]|nr:hypothetical protein [Saprospiraceae bacterium]HMQ83766.1 hypothetical protein [Saprospiraceae bacterium]
MTKRSIKRRLIRAKIALSQTMQKILDINKSRKQLPYAQDKQEKQQELNEELKVLNKMAAYQAQLVRHYQTIIAKQDTAA